MNSAIHIPKREAALVLIYLLFLKLNKKNSYCKMNSFSVSPGRLHLGAITFQLAAGWRVNTHANAQLQSILVSFLGSGA